MGDQPRMTLQTLAVLNVLLEDPATHRYGLEISKGAGLATGSIYPILARLEQAGWLTSDWEDVQPSTAGRPRRRFYQLTAIGEQNAYRAIHKAQQSITRRRDGQPLLPEPGGALT
jgi:PadR family transcriptional regulator, regulatory protein PadR